MKLFALIALAGLAHASTLTFSYSGPGNVSAFGTLHGALVAPGEYEVTSGSITVSDPFDIWLETQEVDLQAAAMLDLNAPSLIGFPGLSFAVETSQGLGPEVTLWGGIGMYGLGTTGAYGLEIAGYGIVNTRGSFTAGLEETARVASVVATPEPAVFVLVGIGFIAIGAKRRTK